MWKERKRSFPQGISNEKLRMTFFSSVHDPKLLQPTSESSILFVVSLAQSCARDYPSYHHVYVAQYRHRAQHPSEDHRRVSATKAGEPLRFSRSPERKEIRRRSAVRRCSISSLSISHTRYFIRTRSKRRTQGRAPNSRASPDADHRRGENTRKRGGITLSFRSFARGGGQ